MKLRRHPPLPLFKTRTADSGQRTLRLCSAFRNAGANHLESHYRTLRPCAAPVEKLHVQVPGLPFQDASILAVYACCAWSACIGIRQITPNWPNDVAGCSGSERKNSTGLPAASVRFAETPVTLSNGGNCSVIG